jgi:site-specific recombinase XerD
MTLDTAELRCMTIRSAWHYFATQLTIVGVGDDACKSIMGYAETSTTARHTHWSPKALAKLTGKTAFTIESA